MPKTLTKQLAEMRAELATLRQSRGGRAQVPRIPLIEFIRLAWEIVEPGVEFVENWHHSDLAEFLEAFANDWCRYLLVNIAPRSGKSILSSIIFPTWLWTHSPHLKLLCGSYSAELAIKFSVARRRLLESDWFQGRWGSLFSISADENTKHFFSNDRGGQMYALGLGGSATGFGADVIVLDDAHAANATETEIATAVRNFRTTFASRLDNKRTGKIMCVGQRIAHADLSGYLLEDPKWVHLFLPSQFHERTTLVTPNDHQVERDNVIRLPSGRQNVRPPGSYLWEDREGPAELDGLKQSLGSTAFSAQYMQNPNPSTGTVFHKEHFLYYTVDGATDSLILHKPSENVTIYRPELSTFMTVDVAVSTKQSADFTVVSTWSIYNHSDLILRHCRRFRKKASDVIAEMHQLRKEWSPDRVYVESAHFGVGLIQLLRDEHWPVLELHPDRDKLSRSTTFQVLLETGRVFFDQNASYLPEVEGELLRFPAGHDDIVDTCSYAGIICSEDEANNRACIPVGSLGPEFRSVFAGGVLPVGKYGY